MAARTTRRTSIATRQIALNDRRSAISIRRSDAGRAARRGLAAATFAIAPPRGIALRLPFTEQDGTAAQAWQLRDVRRRVRRGACCVVKAARHHSSCRATLRGPQGRRDAEQPQMNAYPHRSAQALERSTITTPYRRCVPGLVLDTTRPSATSGGLRRIPLVPRGDR